MEVASLSLRSVLPNTGNQFVSEKYVLYLHHCRMRLTYAPLVVAVFCNRCVFHLQFKIRNTEIPT